MLSKERLIEVYRDWPDEKLKKEFSQAEDYEEIAIEAMTTVMLERGFSIEQEESETLEAFPQSTMEETLERSKIEEFSQPIENQKNADGIYFQKQMLIGSKSNLFGFAGAMAIAGLVCLVVFAATDAVEGWVNLIVFLASIGFAFWAFRILKENKSAFRLFEEGNKLKIRFSLSKEEIEISAPFQYRCYARLEEIHYKTTRIKRPNLYILFDTPDGRVIMLHEDQPATESMPMDWEDIGNNLALLQCDERLTQHGMKKVELRRLKVLLDQLNKK